MEATLNEINAFLYKAHQNFNTLKFKVGYGSSKSTYIVEVLPLKEYKENEEYAQMEVDFCEDFEERHPDYEIIFVSENSLCKVAEAILQIGYNPLGYIPNKTKFKSSLEKWLKNNPKNNYALAS